VTEANKYTFHISWLSSKGGEVNKVKIDGLKFPNLSKKVSIRLNYLIKEGDRLIPKSQKEAILGENEESSKSNLFPFFKERFTRDSNVSLTIHIKVSPVVINKAIHDKIMGDQKSTLKEVCSVYEDMVKSKLIL
jgi:hypothetical protein